MILGVLSCVLTAGLLYLVSRLFRSVVIPWYERVAYKGVDLQGSWTGKLLDTNEFIFPLTITLRQNAHSLQGNAFLDKSSGTDTDRSTHYEVTGSTWEGYVCLNFQSLDRKRLAFATALFQIFKGGREIRGPFTFRDMLHDEIRARQVVLWRDS
jgi:hypothetical protein